MPVKISVGPPTLTINEGSTFMVTNLRGEIAADSELGVFADDTRFLSYYAIYANGYPWTLLTSSAITYYASRIYLTNPLFIAEDGDIPTGTVGLVISRSVSDGIHEDIDITNYNQVPVRFNLEIALRSDFADLFEVRSHKLVRRGRILTEWRARLKELYNSYNHHDEEHQSFRREFTYQLANSDAPASYANGRISFELVLEPHGAWHTCANYMLGAGERRREPLRRQHDDDPDIPFDLFQREWMEQTTKLTSVNEDIYRVYRQSVEDMGSLRLHDQDFAPDVWLPAAGVPWYVTVFGRDSLMVSMQNMLVYPRFALGSLKRLAEMQAPDMDNWRDAEPGKIPHEARFGELAHFGLVPHTPYYGTADATPLYLIVLHEAWKWLGDEAILREYRDVAERCLEWIDRYGDLDGDGFQEYQTRSPQGYENMGWKDSGDAVVYPDGSQVHQPKALCELQGYVFDAWMRMAEIYDALNEPQKASLLRKKAAMLQSRFEERFWCEEIGCYAFGLDPNKQPIKTVASNAGHSLWSGIASPEHAARVVERFFQPDMWSGWGIRTLSANNPAYNPFSYHRGSVWPHDNGVIALGFKRYGYSAEAGRIARDISEAASYFLSYRLPELYAGLERRPGTFPVQYLGANVPQAWATGSLFHLLQAIFGLQADAPNKRLYIDPDLPPWLPDVTLHGLRVGNAQLDLRFWREGDRSRWNPSINQGSIEVQERRWQPWSFEGAKR